MKKAENVESKKKLLPQRVHRDYLLREAENFREHKKGIPEWIKNSDDSYTRFEDEAGSADFSNLPIIVNFDRDEITCLDFGGAEGEVMIEHVPHYGSPDAARYGKAMKKKEVSGGHGNGGKYYALSQFKECQIVSYYNGKFTMLTLDKKGDYVNYKNVEFTPETAIQMIGIDNWNYFKRGRKDLLEKIQNEELNFFCWKGIDPKDKKMLSSQRSLTDLMSNISVHPQARSALRTRIVDILWVGNKFWLNLRPEQVNIDPSIGVKEFILPKILGDYKFNKSGNSVLKIVLSRELLTGDKASLNILEIDANGKNIAYYDLPTLMQDKGISKYIAAYIDCPELKEYKCVSNDRFHLFDNEITNTFLRWCRDRIQEVMDELFNKEKQKEEKRSLEELGNFLKDITDEIAELLEEEDILRQVYKKDGETISVVDVPTAALGFGSEGEIKEKGSGIRRGGTDKKEGESSEKKSKGMIKILLSNIDEDPINPGKTFDMIERQPVLYQRPEDVNYGIWWVNSQKRYIRKINIKDPGSKPFYLFLIKEIVFSHRARRRFKEQEGYDPDGIEFLNFNLIDEIFNKVVQKLGIELSMNESIVDKIREAIKNKTKFTVAELSDDLKIDPNYIRVFLNNPENGIQENFNIRKKRIRGQKGGKVNLYIRKGT